MENSNKEQANSNVVSKVVTEKQKWEKAASTYDEKPLDVVSKITNDLKKGVSDHEGKSSEK